MINISSIINKMEKSPIIIVVILVGVLLFISLFCNTSDKYNNAKSYDNEINSLKNEIISLRNEVSTLSSNLISTQLRLINLEHSNEEVYFTPTSEGYGILKTSSGNLLIILTNIEKYLGGYKLHFDIGNPHNVTFVNPTLTVSWNRDISSAENYSEWQNNQKTKSAELLQNLNPGTWSKITFTISPATEKDIEKIIVKIDTNHVSLFK